MQSAALAESLRRATHPLALPPAGLPWNLQELDGLLAPGEPRQAAVLVGVVAHAGAPTVLLTRRHDGLRHHAGQVSFPGGRIEAFDASPAAAALREASEEVGLQARQATALGYLDPLLTITGFRVVPLVAMVEPGFVPRPDPGEVAEAFEVPLQFLMTPAHHQRHAFELQGRPRQFLSMPWHGLDAQGVPREYFIWGATAAMLRNLYGLLRG